jgi:hypothetical protein
VETDSERSTEHVVGVKSVVVDDDDDDDTNCSALNK